MGKRNQSYKGDMNIQWYKDRVKALTEENRSLKAQVDELKYINNDIQALSDCLKSQVSELIATNLEECAADCGCVVIEGDRTSAAYQDFVGILLRNGYGAEITPVDGGRKLRITIKEGEN